MYYVELYARVRRACMVEGMSVREASRVFGLHRDTVRKMLAYSALPGYRRQDPPRRPKLEPFTGVIGAILEANRQVPRKQRPTAKRIFERLRDEHGFTGQHTIVKDYVREARRQTREMFVPLSHYPGHAQCDFGEALVVIGVVEQKGHRGGLELPTARNLAGKPTFSRSSIFGRRISMVWRFPCRMPSETMPYRTGIRLSRVARNLAKGFPARLLGISLLPPVFPTGSSGRSTAYEYCSILCGPSELSSSGIVGEFQTPCSGACPRRSPSSRWAMLFTISMVATLTVQTRRSRSMTRSLWSEKR